MLGVLYAECFKQAHFAERHYAESHYAECQYAEWCYAECHWALSQHFFFFCLIES
jgi:hypothetical protein